MDLGGTGGLCTGELGNAGAWRSILVKRQRLSIAGGLWSAPPPLCLAVDPHARTSPGQEVRRGTG